MPTTTIAHQHNRLTFLLRLLVRSSLSLKRFFEYVLSHPQGGELLRFVFLGTVMETGRALALKVPEFVKSFFQVNAHFPRADISHEWISTYIEHHNVWRGSRFRTFTVVAKDTTRITDREVPFRSHDGYLDAVYTQAWDPELFFWRRRWITVYVDDNGLTLQVWSLKRGVLDELIQEARNFYQSRTVPPPIVLNDTSGSLVTAWFEGGDFSYTWILEYLQAQDGIMSENAQFCISTRQPDAGWSRRARNSTPSTANQIHALPMRAGSAHRFRWRNYWVQANLIAGGPQITILIHTSDKSVIFEFIEAARAHYAAASMSRVNVHLTNFGNWGRVVTKSRRAYSTLILPEGIKENLLADVREFLDNEECTSCYWDDHVRQSVLPHPSFQLEPPRTYLIQHPHRRGYLLYGEPGTGKSTTVHALAGELGMEIYFISLASPGIDNHTLGELFHSTPPHSILLIEDIDCAFPSRILDSTQLDEHGQPTEVLKPRSLVTLSGLLNILDSVASQEGRVLITTTNHIEQLDPALIRPGRIDMQIKYNLATAEQLQDVFHRFYPSADKTGPDLPKMAFRPGPGIDVDALAEAFAQAIPQGKYSLAQIQGFLLGFKQDPAGAVRDVGTWAADVTAREAELKALRQREAENAPPVLRGSRYSPVGWGNPSGGWGNY
ncbi:Mitochondrial chaperone BCS1 [Mycena indigotica]|uniref:Mitochondrial chaperone BCS1 n=1 Tax=Mycena indigotica TaxID=2126181 RepID=A0A8H6SRZ6_9AGAR|nr:Mitochondrial chaperone BCS1 [Mycena indigotica]KAF7303960.1 Mitochondrial chaperone BCS1 [Mycena indigotica]